MKPGDVLRCQACGEIGVVQKPGVEPLCSQCGETTWQALPGVTAQMVNADPSHEWDLTENDRALLHKHHLVVKRKLRGYD